MPILACTPDPLDTTFSALTAYAQTAEQAGYDILLLEAQPGFDPLAAAAAIAPHTHTIALAAEVSVERGEPFTLARGIAALDHLSNGRAAWTVGAVADAARAREFIAVTRRLWLSWGADAIVFDKANAIFSDTAKVARIDHAGVAFQVRGPLNTPRPPQGSPRLIVANGSPLVDLADVVLGVSGATLIRCSGAALAGARP